MASSDELERMRQQIMRFRELLDIMRVNLQEGDAVYAKLFSDRSIEVTTGKKEKDLQGELAAILIADREPLRRAVMQMRFDSRELERAFEELHDLIAASQEPE